LTTTMPEMKNIISSLEAQGLHPKVKIMVGGAPVNAKFAKDIGADAYAQDVGEAATIAKGLMKR
jgi:5-methyltetrahydrofolate--homocysteine methyltransferase